MRTKAAEKIIHERARRLRDEAKERGKTRRGAIHTTTNPAGAKLLKGFYKAKHGVKPSDTKDATGKVTTAMQEARNWYANLQEPRFRVGESEQRKQRMSVSIVL